MVKRDVPSERGTTRDGYERKRPGGGTLRDSVIKVHVYCTCRRHRSKADFQSKNNDNYKRALRIKRHNLAITSILKSVRLSSRLRRRIRVTRDAAKRPLVNPSIKRKTISVRKIFCIYIYRAILEISGLFMKFRSGDARQCAGGVPSESFA